MKTTFIRNNNSISVQQFNEGICSNTLAPAVYVVKFNPNTGFFLEFIAHEYILPEKLYGNTYNRADRVITTFDISIKSVGVICSGLKGAGKSLLSKTICNKMIKKGYPVIQIQESFSGTNFETFMESIGSCVVLFDEFAKTYPKNQQDLLGFFDGTSQNKRLHLITENNEYRIDEFFIDRPGRVYYHFRYDRIDQDVVTQYCNDRGLEPKITEEIVQATNKILGMSFDILSAIVNDYLQFKEPIQESLSILNVPYRLGTSQYHLVSYTNAYNNVSSYRMEHRNGYFYVFYEYTDDDGDVRRDDVCFDDDEVRDVEGQVYTFKNRDHVLKVFKQVSAF